MTDLRHGRREIVMRGTSLAALNSQPLVMARRLTRGVLAAVSLFNQIPERNRPASLTLVLTEDLHIVEPCGGYLSSPLALPFELCLRLEFFNASAPKASTPTSVFDLAQWNTARFFLYPMGAVNDHGVRFNESIASSFLVAGSITIAKTSSDSWGKGRRWWRCCPGRSSRRTISRGPSVSRSEASKPRPRADSTRRSQSSSTAGIRPET